MCVSCVKLLLKKKPLKNSEKEKATKNAIKAEIFPAVVKNKEPSKNSPNPRMALLQEGGNDVVIAAMTSHWILEGKGRVSEIGCNKSSGNISKLMTTLL
jgi:hypothetical protein